MTEPRLEKWIPDTGKAKQILGEAVWIPQSSLLVVLASYSWRMQVLVQTCATLTKASMQAPDERSTRRPNGCCTNMCQRVSASTSSTFHNIL